MQIYVATHLNCHGDMSLDLVPRFSGFASFVHGPLISRCKSVNGYSYILQANLFLTTLIVFELIDVHFYNEFNRVLAVVTRLMT